MVVRDIGPGPEVLVVTRRSRGFFGGLTAFPGGGVEDFDDGHLARTVVTGAQDDLAFRAAALRELAEETSLAVTTGGVVRAPDERGEALYRALADLSMPLSGESLTYVSTWVTPQMAPRRYDTRFYLAIIDGDPEIHVDRAELVSAGWTTASVALERHEEGTWRMFSPTVAHLAWLAGFPTVESISSVTQGADESPIGPHEASAPGETTGDRIGDEWK
jgi:8-oxo-dGTP pyrophosphatase MutT (NUDIX family)